MTSTSIGVVDHEAGGRDPGMSPALRPRKHRHRIHPGDPSISRPRNRYPGMLEVSKQTGGTLPGQQSQGRTIRRDLCLVMKWIQGTEPSQILLSGDRQQLPNDPSIRKSRIDPLVLL